MGLSKVLHRVRGVVGTGQGKFDVDRLEMRVNRNRQARHLKPVLLRYQFHTLLVWTVRRHHKPHLVELRFMKHVVGDDQMPQMDWVERPEAESDALRR